MPVGEDAGQFARIGIDHQALRIETVLRPGRAMDAITISQPRCCVRQIAMPDLVGAGGERQDMLRAVNEQAEFDAFGVRGEQGEIDAAAIPVRAQGPRTACQQAVVEV